MKDAELRSLLAAVGTGDLRAFETLYAALKTPVFTILLRITQDREVSEDILQELFIRLFQSPPQVKKPRAYIFQMARNLAIDDLRKRPRHEDIEACRHLAQHTGDQAEALDLEAAFRTLSLTERQIVAMHINGGLTFREVATITQTPLGTVLWRYQRAIGKLRTRLEGGTS